MQLWNALKTRVPAPISECQEAVQTAWRDVLQEHEWSFLRAEGFLFIPDLVMGGNVLTISGDRTQLGIDAASYSALAPTDTTDRPVAGRQFRLQNGPYYTIKQLAAGGGGTGVITLDRAFIDQVTYPFTSWSVYQVYYPPPTLPDGVTTDFLRFRNPVGVSRIRNWPIMNFCTREELDYADRLRNQFAPPNRLAPYTVDPVTNIPRFEAWPAPTTYDVYICYYVRKGFDLINQTDQLPQPITRNLVYNRALFHLYDWCEANKSHPDHKARLTGPNWQYLAQQALMKYDGPEGELGRLWKLDQEMFPPDMHPLRMLFPGLNSVQFNGQTVQLPAPSLWPYGWGGI